MPVHTTRPNRAQRTRRRTITIAVATILGVLAGGVPAYALWSATGTVTSSASATTLTAPQTPTATVSGASASLTTGGARASDTLAPTYRLERSTDAAFTTPVTVGTGASAQFSDPGNVAPTATSTRFSTIAIGATGGCGLAGAKLMCWGASTNGQLGVWAAGHSSTPIQVQSNRESSTSQLPADATITHLTAGQRTFCASTERDVYCWGVNSSGQIGTSYGSSVLVPAKVLGLPSGEIASLTIGASHACAIVRGDGAYCWGLNTNGALGRGTLEGTGPFAPGKVLVGAGSDIPANATLENIVAGYNYTCLTASGTAYCWGLNSTGNLGHGGAESTSAPRAVQVGGALPASAVVTDFALGKTIGASNSLTTCALASGNVYCWGSASNGALGAVVAATPTPRKVDSPVSDPATNISGGFLGFCLVAGGASYCWGTNFNGQLADGTTTSSGRPVASILPPGKTVATVDALTSLRCWHFTDGTVGCAGDGTNGAFGEGPDGRFDAIATTIGSSVIPVPKLCAVGAQMLPNALCSLTRGTTYYYRASYTLGSWSSPRSDVATVTIGKTG